MGVIAVETSETESFRIINCTGDAGGEAERVAVRVSSAGADLRGVVVGGAGKSGIADRGGAETETPSIDAFDVFRLGISSSFHSFPVWEFFRRERRDIFRPIASVASFAIAEMDVFLWRLGGGRDS